MENVTHKTLSCGLELACIELPERHAVAVEFRMLAGTAHEPDDRLGLARLIQETIDLGSEHYDGRGLSDAFDAIGASHGGWVGREASAYHCVVLPEYLDRAVELHAEFLRRATFPDEQVKTAVELTKQEWNALQDDAHSLADKLIGAQAYGHYLGRHSYGEPESLDRITRADVLDHWRRTYHTGRMQVAAAGAFQPDRLIATLEKQFEGFGPVEPAGRERFDVSFTARRVHHPKDLEQQQICIAFPGTPITHEDFPVQRVMLGVLSGGMSSRLFTEVREKQGLVYWVNAWSECPRGGGMIFMGASTTPERCERTYRTLLREVDRLSEDLTEPELTRAKTGIVAKLETQGDVTRSRCGELAEGLFQFGHPVDRRERIEQIKAVSVQDVRRYLDDHPRDALSVITLGPCVMEGSQIAGNGSDGGTTA